MVWPGEAHETSPNLFCCAKLTSRWEKTRFFFSPVLVAQTLIASTVAFFILLLISENYFEDRVFLPFFSLILYITNIFSLLECPSI